MPDAQGNTALPGGHGAPMPSEAQGAINAGGEAEGTAANITSKASGAVSAATDAVPSAGATAAEAAANVAPKAAGVLGTAGALLSGFGAGEALEVVGVEQRDCQRRDEPDGANLRKPAREALPAGAARQGRQGLAEARDALNVDVARVLGEAPRGA